MSTSSNNNNNVGGYEATVVELDEASDWMGQATTTTVDVPDGYGGRMTTEHHITAQWVASFLTSPRADGVWLPHHPSNWKAVGAPDHDLLHGWTSPVTPTAGAWAGQVVVKFCPQVIASATQQLPFSPKEQYGFRKTKSGDNPMWTADNYVRAIKRIIDHELSGASRQDAEDALYDEAPQVFAVATEVQMMTLDSANNPTRGH